MKIKAVSITFSPDGTPFLIDDKGRLWMDMSSEKTPQWKQVPLPHEPKVTIRKQSTQQLPYLGHLGKSND